MQSWHNWSVHGVTKVRVDASSDGLTWMSVEGGRIWETPGRRNHRNRCEFAAPVACRYVRIYGVDFADREGDGTRRGHGASLRCALLVGPLVAAVGPMGVPL